LAAAAAAAAAAGYGGGGGGGGGTPRRRLRVNAPLSRRSQLGPTLTLHYHCTDTLQVQWRA